MLQLKPHVEEIFGKAHIYVCLHLKKLVLSWEITQTRQKAKLKRVYLRQQEGEGGKGKGPAILIAEIGFITFSPVQHLIVDAGDVENKTHHQRETCEQAKDGQVEW